MFARSCKRSITEQVAEYYVCLNNAAGHDQMMATWQKGDEASP